MNVHMSSNNQGKLGISATVPPMQDIFGFQVPTRGYLLHKGHTWAKIENSGQVRVGVDDFSQKILGVADEILLPQVGKEYFQNHVCLSLIRQGAKATFVAPVDGVVEAINDIVRKNPSLVHDDPYVAGWLFLVTPTNLQQNLVHLVSDEAAVAWMDAESHRLLGLMEEKVGITLPDGGKVADDVYGNYPKLGWRPLIHEFFLQDLTRNWKKRS